MVHDQGDRGAGEEGRERFQALDGREEERRGASAPDRRERDEAAPVGPELEAGLDERGAEEVGAERLEAGAIVRGDPDVGVESEAIARGLTGAAGGDVTEGRLTAEAADAGTGAGAEGDAALDGGAGEAGQDGRGVGERVRRRRVGDGVLMQLPVYPPILRLPDNVGMSRDGAELIRGVDGRYTIDFDALERAITPRTRMVLLCNPHNPVGRVFTRDELGRMADIALRRGLVICADEIHGDLTYPGHAHLPIASLDPGIEARTITLMAPSKTFNLAGLRCSLAVIPNQALREKFVASRVDMVQTPNILGYTAMLAAFRDGQPWLDELLRYLEANRDYLVTYVRANFTGVEMGVPEGTYLAWLDCRQARIPNDDPFTFFLETGRVAFNDGATFGRGGQGFVRLNFGCPRSLLTQGLERIGEALGRLPRGGP